jgi:copper chaperone
MMLIFINSKYDIFGFLKGKTGTANQGGETNDPSLHTFKVPDMTCQHCKMTVTKSLEEMPGTGSISVDLENKTVSVENPNKREDILAIIKEAGFSPQ